MPKIKLPSKILVNTRIMPSVHAELVVFAEKKGVTISDVLRVALDMYLAEERDR